MKTLSIEDTRRLLAAQGWIELGDAVSAGDELADISPQEWTHPAVLQIRYVIYAKRGQWDTAAEVAEALASLLPDAPGTWINLAFATRRKTGGGVPAAKKILLTAEPKFPGDYVIPFNLACYCSQLHEFEQAERWLKKAAAIDEKAVQEIAADDLDLKPFWESRGGAMVWTEE